MGALHREQEGRHRPVLSVAFIGFDAHLSCDQLGHLDDRAVAVVH